MKMKQLLIVGTLLASLGFGSVASAHTNPSGPSSPNLNPDVHVDKGPSHKEHKHQGMVYIGDAAKVLKMDKVTLYKELKSGKSLADVAKEKNVSTDELKKGMQGALSDRLDKAVNTGKITVAQKKEILLRSSQHMDQLINHKGLIHPHGGMVRFLWKESAAILKEDPKTLSEQLKSGKSLVDIAKEKGMTQEQFKSQLLAAQKARLDEAVKNGKLSKEQEQMIITKTQNHIDEWITRKDWGQHKKED